MSSFSGIVPLETLKRITRQSTIFPFFHLISDEEIPHVKFLYRARNTNEFKADLELFLRHYKPIGITELLDAFNAERPLPDNSFLLSFDDGLREFHDIVAPILLQKGIPATCFLNSAFIDNCDLFFRYKASLLIGRLKESGIQQEPVRTWFHDHHLSENTHDYGLLSIRYSNRHLLDELAALLGYDFSEYLLKNRPYLDSIQVRTLIGQGFTFGAHSIDHPEFRFLPEDEQIRQTSESILDIKEKFGLHYKLFSFPFTDFGIPASFFDRIFGPADPVADLTFGGAGLKNDSVAKNIQRIPFEEGRLSGKQILATEYVYYMIKSIFGKNMIRR